MAASSAARRNSSLTKRARARSHHELVLLIRQAFVEHNLVTYAAAIAFQALVALIPLSLLALGLLGALGRQSVWTRSLAPGLRNHVTPPVYHGIDYSVRRILDHGTAGLIAASTLLSLWYLTAAMRAVMEALNRIHDVDDERPWWRRVGGAVALAAICGGTLLGSVLLVELAPTPNGAAGIGLACVRWVGSILLLGLAIAVLVRFAPAEHPEPRWASAGSLLVIATWIGASFLFKLWINRVADFRSPVGSLTGLLALTGYLFLSAAVFLVGVQLDELLRREHHGRRR